MGLSALFMPPISKPMLAGTFDPAKASFPYIATPKIDGIRFTMVGGKAVSRTFKPIRNEHIQQLLSAHLPNGVDGELTCGNSFQTSTSGVMSITGKPNFKAWIFDYVREDRLDILPYKERLADLDLDASSLPFECEVLTGTEVADQSELDAYEGWMLWQEFEGVMVRSPGGGYKFGRATVRENTLLKVKRFKDSEAELLRIEEKMTNANPAESDAFGRVKRSTHASGMVPAGTTGALVVRDELGREFGIGSGLDDALRDEIWANPDKYLGRLVKYKYLDHGVKELPRHPVFLGFRDPDDVTP